MDESIGLRESLASLFGRGTAHRLPPRPSTDPKKRKTEDKKFTKSVCLIPHKDQTTPPTGLQKLELYKADLNEKKISFGLYDSPQTVASKLFRFFPPLDFCGGYEIMFMSKHKLVTLSYGPCDAMQLKTTSGTGKIYVRPIQKNVSIKAKKTIPENEEKCLTCQKVVTLKNMKDHVEEHTIQIESDDESSYEPFIGLYQNKASSSSASSSKQTEIPQYLCSEAAHSSGKQIQNENSAIEGEISAVPLDDSHEGIIASILQKLEKKLDGMEEPKDVLAKYQKIFLQGRQLNAEQSGELEGEVFQIYISRSDPLETALEEMLLGPNIRCPLCVQFYGETALDTGGPRRDFFRIAIKEMTKKNIFSEVNGQMKLTPNEGLVHNNYYYLCGLITGLSVLEGGDFLFLGDECFDEPKSVYIKQFQKGLKRCGILQLINAHPSVKYLWANKTSNLLSITKLLGAFAIQFAPEGSNMLPSEEKSYQIFVNYIREVAGKGRPDFSSINLKTILAYITGNESIPILGFCPPATINFKNDNSFLPHANTCINRITLARVPTQTDVNLVKRALDWAFSSMEFSAEY